MSDESDSSQPPSTGLLPILRAITSGETTLDPRSLGGPLLEHALRNGLGPVIARVSADAAAGGEAVYRQSVRAADLTARLLTAEKYDTLSEVLGAAEAVGCRLVLLKGISTALRYYPEPHLRAMGDIDLLAPPERQPALEQQLRGLGFQQRSHEPGEAFVQRHHSMPFWHPSRRVWIEVHTRLHPRQYPLAGHPLFSPDMVSSDLSDIAVGARRAFVMTHERQLVYTSARWSETFDDSRGIFPLLDAALLLRMHGDTLDWDRVRAIVDGSWAATALRLMLTYLSRTGLAHAPAGIMSWLAENDRYSTQLSLWVLNHLISGYLIEGQPFGTVITTRENVAAVWGAMVRPGSPWFNILRTPYSVCGSLYRTNRGRFRR